MAEIERLIDSMEIDDALTTIAAVANKLLIQISDEARLEFVISLVGDSGGDNISSMANF